MGKTKEQHEKDIVEVIVKHKITRIAHLFAFYTDLKTAQFYNLKLEESEAIKEAFSKNRSSATAYLLQKWIGSENPTLQIAAYRLTCSDEERQMLNQQYIDHTTAGKEIKVIMPKRDS